MKALILIAALRLVKTFTPSLDIIIASDQVRHVTNRTQLLLMLIIYCSIIILFFFLLIMESMEIINTRLIECAVSFLIEHSLRILIV